MGKSMVYRRVHALFSIFYGSGQMYNDMYNDICA